MKECRRCNRTRPVSEFSRNRRENDGRQRWCQSCMKEHRSKRRAIDSAAGVHRQRRRLYGLTAWEFESLVARQDGKCAICGRTPTGKPWEQAAHSPCLVFVVDVKGAICGPCNRGIGLLGDNADRLAAAWSYLTADVVGSAPRRNPE